MKSLEVEEENLINVVVTCEAAEVQNNVSCGRGSVDDAGSRVLSLSQDVEKPGSNTSKKTVPIIYVGGDQTRTDKVLEYIQRRRLYR